MSLSGLRAAFANMLSANVPSAAAVYASPQQVVEKTPAIVLMSGRAGRHEERVEFWYEITVTMLAYAGANGERAAEAEDEIDALQGEVLKAVTDNDKTDDWDAVEIVDTEQVMNMTLDGEDFVMARFVVRLHFPYSKL